MQHISSSGVQAEAAGRSPEAAPPAVTTTTARDESIATDSNASDDAAEFIFRPGIDRVNPIQTAGSYPSPLFGDDNNNNNSQNNSNSNSSTTKALHEGTGCGTPVGSAFDCFTVAINLLQDLNKTRSTNVSSPGPFGASQPPATLDASVSSASSAIKRVSAILICPCSRKTDVGLLAAAVCAALLDTYESILRDHTGPRAAASSPTSGHSRGLKGTPRNQMREAQGMGVRGRADEMSTDANIMRMLEELPKVANLIMQFTKRYCEEAEKCSRDFLQVLAASKMARVRAMIDEVSNWVAQV